MHGPINLRLTLDCLIPIKTCSEIAGSNCHFVRSEWSWFNRKDWWRIRICHWKFNGKISNNYSPIEQCITFSSNGIFHHISASTLDFRISSYIIYNFNLPQLRLMFIHNLWTFSSWRWSLRDRNMLEFYCFNCKLYTAIECICWILQYISYYRFIRNIVFTFLKVAEPFLHSGTHLSVGGVIGSWALC